MAFDAAAELYEGVDPFTAGVRMTIETMLQSPHFLYRVELGGVQSASGDVLEPTQHDAGYCAVELEGLESTEQHGGS